MKAWRRTFRSKLQRATRSHRRGLRCKVRSRYRCTVISVVDFKVGCKLLTSSRTPMYCQGVHRSQRWWGTWIAAGPLWVRPHFLGAILWHTLNSCSFPIRFISFSSFCVPRFSLPAILLVNSMLSRELVACERSFIRLSSIFPLHTDDLVEGKRLYRWGKSEIK